MKWIHSSGWLFMCLTGAVYAYGANKLWMALGLIIGIIINYITVAPRMRDYNVRLKADTLPELLSNRFGKNGKRVRTLAALFLLVFSEIYLASALIAGAKIFSAISDDYSYKRAMLGTAILILLYGYVRKYLIKGAVEYAVGVFALFVMIAVSVIALYDIGIHYYVFKLVDSNLHESASEFLNVFTENGAQISLVSVIGQISCGLVLFGMPHLLMSFLVPEDEADFLRTRRVMIGWSFLTFVVAGALGLIARAYLSPIVMTGPNFEEEGVVIAVIKSMFSEERSLPVIGMILTLILAFMVISHAVILLFSMSKSAVKDLYGAGHKEHNYYVFVLPLLLFLSGIFVWKLSLSVTDVTRLAWEGLGVCFGPVVLLSLFWRRMNHVGACAGMIAGCAGMLIWDFAALVPYHGTRIALWEYTDLPALPAAFLVALIAAITASLVTRQEEEQVLKDFDDVYNGFLE